MAVKVVPASRSSNSKEVGKRMERCLPAGPKAISTGILSVESSLHFLTKTRSLFHGMTISHMTEGERMHGETTRTGKSSLLTMTRYDELREHHLQ